MTSSQRLTRSKGHQIHDEDSEVEDELPWLHEDEASDVELHSDDEDAQLNELLDATTQQGKSQSDGTENGTDGDGDDKGELDTANVALKLKRLQEFVKQSQVYSGIIADTLLERSMHTQDEQPAKKKSRRQEQPSLLTNCTLKPYQLEGLTWLVTLYENGLNGILADEMGLGKTIQSIALLAFIYEMDTKGPFLIAAPLSTVDNWISEFRRFAPSVPVLKYYDSQGAHQRRSLLTEFFNKNNNEGVIVTSYEIIIRDINEILSHQWKFLIVDEGHRLKNINCKLIRELKRINTSNRLLLTGTPLQNNLGELWSLLNFIMPDIFADFEIFNKWFDLGDLNLQSSSSTLNKIINDELEKNLISNLHTILKPFLLRRLKKTVLAGILPPKREYIINCPLTPLQNKFYKNALSGKLKETMLKQAIKEFFTLNRDHVGTVSNKSIRTFIDWKLQDNDSKPRGTIAKMDKLYQAHIHKEVLNKRLQNMMVQLRQVVDSTFLFYFPYIQPEELSLDVLLQTSGKLQILQQLVPKLINEGHKVLIFSQFVNMLDLIEDWCELNDFQACRIDGSMDNEVRQEQIEKFNSKTTDSHANDVFLLSTRAGGLGINLTAADSVVIFDSDWNPQVDLQAMDRTHRIGQDRPVVVYRLCCDNTVEHVILTRAVSKRKLEKLVIQMGKFNTLKRLALNENSFLSSTTNTSTSSNKDLVQELSQLLLSKESSIGFSRGDDTGELTFQELQELTDRSAEAYSPSSNIEHPHIRLFETTSGFDN